MTPVMGYGPTLFLHGGFGHSDTKLTKLARDAGRIPLKEPALEESIRCMERGTLDGSLIGEDLMPQGDVFKTQ